ncbi:hypothetical protein D3C87_89140 [compost metagenome]
MKKIMPTVIALTAIASVSQAVCEQDMKTVSTCKSTPKEGDSELAGYMFEKISICKNGDATYLAFEAEGRSESTPTEPIERTGATEYPFGDAGKFETKAAPAQGGGRAARFYMNMGDGSTISSTYACFSGVVK